MCFYISGLNLGKNCIPKECTVLKKVIMHAKVSLGKILNPQLLPFTIYHKRKKKGGKIEMC